MSWLAGAFFWGALIAAFVGCVHVWEDGYHRFMRFCDEMDRNWPE